ncbi:MAG TPA: ATP-binding domain-containing protein [Gammaproteobacteria bacterium]|nr:ATP-binding domain-containing protein [Gammaproteobacteria bacterium]
MARLLPSDLSAAALSGANEREIDTLKRLGKELPNDYSVYHSVHWSKYGKNGSAHGEVDFAIINRSGDVLIIEQKNGPLEETESGLLKRYNNGAKCLNSQIERNTWNLKDRFKDRVSNGRDLSLDHLLYCPDHRIVRIDAPGIDRSRTIDATSDGKLIERISELLGPGVDTDDNWTEIVCDYFGQSFRIVPDVSSYVSSQARSYTSMVEGLAETIDKLEFSPFRLRVVGTAGCGKSQLALDYCQRQVKAGQRVLMLCFNRPLADRLRNLAPAEAIVDTYYGFCKRTLETLNSDVKVRPIQEPGFWRVVQDQLVGVDIPDDSLFDALIVDEGQDFKQEWWEILHLFVRPEASVLWLEDPAQNLRDTDEVALDEFVTLRESANFRSPATIAEYIRGVLDIDFVQRNELPGMGVHVETYATNEEQKKIVTHRINELVKAGFRHEEIAIVSCRGLSSTGFSDCEKLGSVPLRKFTQHYTADGEQIYTDGKICFDSIYRFKGRQAPAVILVDIDETVNGQDLARRILYCGMTRATVRLEILVDQESSWSDTLKGGA